MPARPDKYTVCCQPTAATKCVMRISPVIAPTVTLAEFMSDPPAGARLVFLERDEGQPSLATLPRHVVTALLVGRYDDESTTVAAKPGATVVRR